MITFVHILAIMLIPVLLVSIMVLFVFNLQNRYLFKICDMRRTLMKLVREDKVSVHSEFFKFWYFVLNFHIQYFYQLWNKTYVLESEQNKEISSTIDAVFKDFENSDVEVKVFMKELLDFFAKDLYKVWIRVSRRIPTPKTTHQSFAENAKVVITRPVPHTVILRQMKRRLPKDTQMLQPS